MGNQQSGLPHRVFDCESEPWSKEHLEELRKATPEISPPEAKQISNGRIVLLGPSKSGKSSFMNSIVSVHKKRNSQKAAVSQDSHSYTKEFNQILCGKLLISDTMGIDLEDGLKSEDFSYLLRGNVPKDYKFDPKSPIQKGTENFIEHPKNKDRVHCVILCVGADWITGSPPKELLEKIRKFLTLARDEHVPRMVLLTKIDKHSKSVQKDLKRVTKSSKIKEAVRTASESLEIPEMYIHPVKNFTHELSPTTEASILIQHALKFAVGYAQDCIEELQDE